MSTALWFAGLSSLCERSSIRTVEMKFFIMLCAAELWCCAAGTGGSHVRSTPAFSAAVNVHGTFGDIDDQDSSSRTARERKSLLRSEAVENSSALETGHYVGEVSTHPAAFVEQLGVPVNCEWATWGEWTKCPVTCGGGSQARERTKAREAADGGTACPGSSREVVTCGLQGCPVDCAWGSWGTWSLCTKSCGGGEIDRYRTKNNETRNGGKDCVGTAKQRQECNIGGCPMDCVYENWGKWGECSQSCGGGHQQRVRTVKTPAVNGGRACQALYGADTATQICQSLGCPTPCEWGNWGQWDQCTKSCGGGQVTRTRPIAKEPTHNGAPCSPSGASETATCNDLPCALVNNAVSSSSSSPSPSPSSATVASTVASSPVAENITGDMTISVADPRSFLLNPNSTEAMKDGVADVSGVSASIVKCGLTSIKNFSELNTLLEHTMGKEIEETDGNVLVWYSIKLENAADANGTANEVLNKLQALRSDTAQTAFSAELHKFNITNTINVSSVKASVQYSQPTAQPTAAPQVVQSAQAVSSATSPTPAKEGSGGSTTAAPSPSLAQRWTFSRGAPLAVTLLAILSTAFVHQ